MLCNCFCGSKKKTQFRVAAVAEKTSVKDSFSEESKYVAKELQSRRTAVLRGL